jgi:hypothetical protein
MAGRMNFGAFGSSVCSASVTVLYIMAPLALAGGVCALLQIRSKDLVKRDGAAPTTADAPDSPAPART